MGRSLTALCALAALKDIDPELALNSATGRVIDRFARAESGVKWDDLTAEEKQNRWAEAKA